MSPLLLALALPALADDGLLAGAGAPDGATAPAAPAPALPTLPSGPTGRIWNGATVGATDFEAVVALYLQDAANTFCSGTLVDPEWVLTAAHCLAEPDMQQYISDGVPIYVGIGRAVPYVSRVRVDSYAVHAQYDPNDAPGSGHDIALVHLAQAVTSIAPIPYNTTKLDSTFVGLPVTVVGYGITGDNLDDSGTKRRAELSLYDLQGDLVDLFNGSLGRDGQPIAWDSSSNACNGDSGGASLAQDGGGDWVLVGVNDVVFPQCAHGGTGSTRTDLYAAWIQSYVGGSGSTTQVGTPETPDWFTLDATSGGRLKAPDLGEPARPGDAAGYPTVTTDTPTEDTGRGCATVDGAGVLALTGLLGLRRRRSRG